MSQQSKPSGLICLSLLFWSPYAGSLVTEALQNPGAGSSGLREAEEAVEVIVRLRMFGKVMGLLTAVALCLSFSRGIVDHTPQ
jgi:hypothetical protein